jgi:hypothetical protein
LSAGSYEFTATDATSAGTSAASSAVDLTVLDPPPSIPLDPTIVTQQPGSAPADIGNNTVLEIDTPDSGSVAFTGTNGILRLDQPSTFTGNVSGFRAQNGIDLPGIAFDAQTTLGYSPNSNGTAGTLSITDGTQSVKIALLGQYIASSFVTASDNHGGTIVLTTATESGNQSLLTHPQH